MVDGTLNTRRVRPEQQRTPHVASNRRGCIVGTLRGQVVPCERQHQVNGLARTKDALHLGESVRHRQRRLNGCSKGRADSQHRHSHSQGKRLHAWIIGPINER